MRTTAETSERLSVAVFTSREPPEVVVACVRAAVAASHRAATIDVLVNGNRGTAEGVLPLLSSLRPEPAVRLRLWFLPLGDKAATFNSYVHALWPEGALSILIDGYAMVDQAAFAQIDGAYRAHPTALAVAGVPRDTWTNRRLRKEMIREAGLHGNLYALTPQALARLRALPFLLPVGIYRTDATLRAAISFALNPSAADWDPKEHIAIAESATWDVKSPAWWSPKEWPARLRRRRRQAQGELENRAVRWHLARRRLPLTSLPETVESLVANWAEQDPEGFAEAMRSPLLRKAWSQLQEGRDWSRRNLPRELLFDSASPAVR